MKMADMSSKKQFYLMKMKTEKLQKQVMIALLALRPQGSTWRDEKC